MNAIYLDQVNDSVRGSWAYNVKQLLDCLGYSYLFHDANITKLQLTKIIETLYDQYYQHWYCILRESPKLKYYNMIKSNSGFEKYLNCIKCKKYLVAVTKIRCSSHKLAIEEGRFRNIAREERKCIFCPMNCIEDEYHFILVCPFYRDIRMSCLSRYYCHWPTLQKFKSLMSNTQVSVLNNLGKYIYLSYQRRENTIGS